jgi:superfamily I DNA and/or RNA helicase
MGGEIERALGPSCWLNIDSAAGTKWSPSEGEVVVLLLKQLAAAAVLGPDIFIITPFRIVASEMRRRLENETELFSSFGLRPDDWVRDRVGTIHTFQGREAHTVILLLGAPKPAQSGARGWAGKEPNIVNVAVSRAQQNLYVVGSYGAWSRTGFFREIARDLPRREAIVGTGLPNRAPGIA